MNKKQLAKLLIKHPEIKALYESQALDASTVNKVIAEEIMEADLSPAQKDEIQTLRDYMGILRGQAKEIMDELKDAKLDGDEEGVEELSAELNAMKQKRSEVQKRIKAIQATAEKAAQAAIQTEPTEDDQQVAQALKDTTDAMKPAVDAARQDADIAAKVDNVSQAVDAAAEAAKDGLGDIEIVDDESGDDSSTTDDNDTTEDGESDESLLDKVKAGFGAAIDSVDSKEDRDSIAQAVIDFAQDPDNLNAASTIASLGSAAASLAGLGGISTVLNGANYVAKISEINSLIAAGEADKAKEEVTGLAIGVAIDVIPWGAALKKVPGSEKAISKVTEQAMKIPAVKTIADEAVKAAVASGGKLSSEALGKVAKAVAKYVSTEVLNPYSSEEPQEPQTVTLNNNTPKIQQLANAFANLSDEQYDRLRQVIDAEIEKAKTEQNPWQDLPQGFQEFDGSSAILMFEPSQDNMMTLTPEVSGIIPINDDTGQSVDFTVEKQEVIDSKEEMDKIDQKLKEKEKMANEKDEVVKDAQDSWNKWKNKAFKEITDEKGKPVLSNIENAESLFQKELDRRLNIYLNSNEWGDLVELGHEVPESGATETLEQWQNANEEKLRKYFEGVSERMKKIKGLDAQGAPNEIKELVDGLSADALKIQDSIDNVAADDDVSDADIDGAEVEGITAKQGIEKAIKALNPAAPDFPTLLGNDKFAELLFAKLQAAAPEQPSSEDDNTETDDNVDGTASSSDTNLDSNMDTGKSTGNSQTNLEEALSGIYLAEEEVAPSTDQDGAKPPAEDEGDGGSAIDVEDAKKLNAEIKALQGVLGQSKNQQVKAINVAELAKQAFGEIPATDGAPTADGEPVPSVEEATQEGQDSALADSESEDMKYQDLYAGFKQQMDTFFSMDGKSDGFMDQFLLKYQAAKLAELIGNLEIIIRGDVPKPGEDNEGEARALSTATQQDDANMQTEAQGQAVSEKGQLELKTRLVAMLKGLKSLRAMMNSYKQHATRSSANPALDGSALKKSLQRYMSNLQINIKAIVETCYIEHSKLTQTQSDDVSLNEPANDQANQSTGDNTTQNVEDPESSVQKEQLYEAIFEAIAPALDGVYLMEDAAREEKMNIVRDVYGSMMQIYEGSMQSALENSQRQTAMKNAKDIMEFAKKEEFVALFPTFVGSFGGKPQTINQATDAIDGLLREFVETMKKVIVLAKGATIDETTLAKVIEDLSMMSLMMQNYFGVKSLLDDDMQARVEKMLAQREGNESLSDNPKSVGERSSGNFVDKAKELAGKGLEKLKQAFGWLSDEVQEMIDTIQTPLPVLEPMINAIDLSEKPDEWKNQTLQDAMQAVMWYNTQSDEQQAALKDYYLAIDANILSEDKSEFFGNVIADAGLNSTRKTMNTTFKTLDKPMRKVLIKMMESDTENMTKFFVIVLKDRDLATEIFKVLEGLPDSPISPSSPKAADDDKSSTSDTTDTDETDSSETTSAELGDDSDASKTMDEIALLLMPMGRKDIDVGADNVGWSGDDYEVNNEPLISVIENFGLNPPSNSADMQNAVVDFAKFAKILSYEVSTEESVGEGLIKKTIKGVKDKFLKRKIKKLFFEKAKFDAKSEAGETLDLELRRPIDQFLRGLEHGEKVQQNVMKLINSILRNKGDLTKVAEESKTEATTSRPFSRTGEADPRQKTQRTTDELGAPNLEESLKPIIEKMLKEHYNH